MRSDREQLITTRLAAVALTAVGVGGAALSMPDSPEIAEHAHDHCGSRIDGGPRARELCDCASPLTAYPMRAFVAWQYSRRASDRRAGPRRPEVRAGGVLVGG